MSSVHNTDERPIDERRAEHDAKRDMTDADKQDAYDARLGHIVRDIGIFGLTGVLPLADDEQETTED